MQRDPLLGTKLCIRAHPALIWIDARRRRAAERLEWYPKDRSSGESLNMKRRKLMQIIGWLVLGVVVLGVIYAFVVRPWHLRRGSTKDEVQRSLPGDELVPNPKFVWNQAITINAPAAEVWPWLVQIGNQRAGWYSWDGHSSSPGGRRLGGRSAWFCQPDHPGTSRPGGWG